MNQSKLSKGNTTNGKAIASLVFGILSIIIPFVGLALGTIGILLSKKATKEMSATNQNGKALATASLICSSIGMIVQLLGVIGFLNFMYLVK